MPALPSASHAKPNVPCVRSMPVHRAAMAGTAKACVQHHGSEQAEQRQVQGFQHAEQRKRPPTSPMAHAAVEFEDELNPIADAEPIDDSRELAEDQAPQWTRLARQCNQQRSQCNRGQECHPKTRKDQVRESENEKDRRQQGEGEVDERVEKPRYRPHASASVNSVLSEDGILESGRFEAGTRLGLRGGVFKGAD